MLTVLLRRTSAPICLVLGPLPKTVKTWVNLRASGLIIRPPRLRLVSTVMSNRLLVATDSITLHRRITASTRLPWGYGDSANQQTACILLATFWSGSRRIDSHSDRYHPLMESVGLRLVR
jgi:hypothetical protein